MMGKHTYVPESCKELLKALQSLSYTRSIYEVFQDWLCVSAIAISNAVDYRDWKQREEVYLQTVSGYTKAEQERLSEAQALLVLALQREQSIHGPTDILGQVFHALELHNKYKGQFFSPPSICEMMGRITLANESAAQIIAKNGYIALCEPCIGSGGMVLGAAKAMADWHLNYQTQLVVTGIDIDIKCVQMAYLQLSLLGIPAVVIHGNSITNETWSKWYTPAYILGGWSHKVQEAHLEELFKNTKTA